MATYKTKALVLRRLAFGEKDKIVTVLTRDKGKLRAVAKGARGPASRLSGATEPLTVFDGLIAEGTRLDIVSQAEVRESFPQLRADYGMILRATYLCELVDHLVMDRDPQPSVFDTLVAGLYLLPGARQPDFVLHAIELQLLGLLGYEPRFDSCVRCMEAFSRVAPPTGFAVALGGVLCDRCADMTNEKWIACSPRLIDAFDRLATATDTRELLGGELEPGLMGGIHRILRAHLRARLDRDVRTSGFLDAYRLEEPPTV